MGNFSQLPRGSRFEQLKHYAGVRLQQGVPIVDADWNELEDIRKFELQAFLKWFVGDGVPLGDDGFSINLILELNNKTAVPDDFFIAAGRCLVDGWDVINSGPVVYQTPNGASGGWRSTNPRGMRYTEQYLFNRSDRATAWGVDPLAPYTFPTGKRTDLVYLDTWEREVCWPEDPDLRDARIDLDTCVRLKREWVVRTDVDIGTTTPAERMALLRSGVAHQAHAYYPLALLSWSPPIVPPQCLRITDLRRSGWSLAALADEVVDARGMKGNLGNRLDVSLTRGGELREHVVANAQIIDGAAIQEQKIQFQSGGHAHSGGQGGQAVAPQHLAGVGSAVTASNLNTLTAGYTGAPQSSGAQGDASGLHYHRFIPKQEGRYSPSLASILQPGLFKQGWTGDWQAIHSPPGVSSDGLIPLELPDNAIITGIVLFWAPSALGAIHGDVEIMYNDGSNGLVYLTGAVINVASNAHTASPYSLTLIDQQRVVQPGLAHALRVGLTAAMEVSIYRIDITYQFAQLF